MIETTGNLAILVGPVPPGCGACLRFSRNVVPAAASFSPEHAIKLRIAQNSRPNPSTFGARTSKPNNPIPSPSACRLTFGVSQVRQLSATGTLVSALWFSEVCRVPKRAACRSFSCASAISTAPNNCSNCGRSRPKSSGRAVATTVAAPTLRHGRTASRKHVSAPSWSIRRGSGRVPRRLITSARHWIDSAAISAVSVTQPCIKRISPNRAASRACIARAFTRLPGSSAPVSSKICPSGCRPEGRGSRKPGARLGAGSGLDDTRRRVAGFMKESDLAL